MLCFRRFKANFIRIKIVKALVDGSNSRYCSRHSCSSSCSSSCCSSRRSSGDGSSSR